MKIKIRWELNRLFYSSLKDPKLARDVERGEQAVDAFVEKYRADKRWLFESRVLAAALTAYEKLSLESKAAPIMYASYRKELNANDKEAEALVNTLSERFTKRGNKLLFFELELAKVPENIRRKFLRAPELKRFRYWLKRLFETAKHNLSEPEERLAGLLADASFGRWVQMMENLLNTRAVKSGGKKMPLNEALMSVSKLPTAKRRALHKAIMAELKGLGEVAESELNAVVSRKKVMDELRHFDEPVDATILGYENDKQSVLALVDAVSKNFDLSKRFYKVKTKLLKAGALTYADRSAPVGKVSKKISFEEAAALVRKAFAKLHPRYAAIFERLLKNGQVDVYPKAGKTGGAYCSHMTGEPTMLLLNHVDNANSLLTLAHEMGHAIHSERSKKQKPLYEGYSIAAAETASTFFERAAFEALAATLPEHERLVALHDRVQDDISTVFRQIACFNFETEMHQQIREKGLLTKEKLAKLMNKHMASYLGEAVTLTPEDGYFFVAWSHIRRFFYVYSYAWGLLTSRALWERVKKDKKFVGKVDEFLQSGGSASPEDIFKKCGLNLYSPKVFLEGLKSIEKDVAELEQAVAK
jgi:oligoendopeptidase F